MAAIPDAVLTVRPLGSIAGPVDQDLPFNRAVQKTVMLIQNDQSMIKGFLWGLGAYKLGAVALGLGAGALVSSPFIVTPLFFLPIALGSGAVIAGSLTMRCLENASYHLLDSRRINVILLN